MKGFGFTRMFTSVSPFGSCAVQVPKHAARQEEMGEEQSLIRDRAPRSAPVSGFPAPGPTAGMGPQLDPAVHPSFTLHGSDRQDWGCWALKEAKLAFKRQHLEGITPVRLQGLLPASQPPSPAPLGAPVAPAQPGACGWPGSSPAGALPAAPAGPGVAPPRLDARGEREPGRFGARRRC